MKKKLVIYGQLYPCSLVTTADSRRILFHFPIFQVVEEGRFLLLSVKLLRGGRSRSLTFPGVVCLYGLAYITFLLLGLYTL